MIPTSSTGGAKMPRFSRRLARTDQRIREFNREIELCRNRVARNLKNPALAEQANRLLLAVSGELDELLRYRKRLLRAVHAEEVLSPQELPDRAPPTAPYGLMRKRWRMPR